MTEATLARAQSGDGEAFRELIDPHRRELQAHCYRILGSVQDAEEVLQEGCGTARAAPVQRALVARALPR
jgi:DNA-directed RNA polymerase specialized sigma24 family protein